MSLTDGGIATTLAAATLAADLTAASLASSVTGGSYSAELPVYYPTSTCYSGSFTIGGTGTETAAPLAGFLVPGETATVSLGLPDITNAAIASLSLADAIGNPDVFQTNLESLSAAFSGAFEAAMAGQTQVVVGDGTKEFAAAYSTYDAIGAYVAATLPAFVPQCDQNATATATATAGVITAITVVQTGESYLAAPAITILDLAGTGSGATATAVMTDDGNGKLQGAVDHHHVGRVGLFAADRQHRHRVGGPGIGRRAALQRGHDRLQRRPCDTRPRARWLDGLHHGQLRQRDLG